MQETWVQFLGPEDPLEKEMATHSSILAWRIPGTQEPGGLPSMGSLRVDMTEATRKQQQQHDVCQAFLAAQLVKNPPAIQETLVLFLGWEDLL